MCNQGKSTFKTRKSTSHAFHLLMCWMTFGLWAPMVWWPLTMWHAMGPRHKTTIRHH